MLVVTSNWNCSDKTLVASHSKKQFDHFLKLVHRAALRASMRFDGRYQPIERLDLVFAGDTYDWLTSRKWLDDHRPWGMPQCNADHRAGGCSVFTIDPSRHCAIAKSYSRWTRTSVG